MSTGTLQIDRVNFELLEDQRQALIRVLFAKDISEVKAEYTLLEGLLAMLDAWADDNRVFLRNEPDL